MQNVILNSFQNLTPVRGGQPVGHCPSDAPQNIINGASNDAPCLLPHCPIAFGCWVSPNLHSAYDYCFIYRTCIKNGEGILVKYDWIKPCKIRNKSDLFGAIFPSPTGEDVCVADR
jgi:hypothetical protein